VLDKEKVLTDYQIPDSIPCTLCSNCVTSIELPIASDGVGNFNYVGNSTVRLEVRAGGLALSYLNIQFFAYDINPHVISLSPPLETTNNSSVKLRVLSIHGTNFFPNQFLYHCEFNGRDVNLSCPAFPIGEQTYQCILPDIKSPQTVDIWFYPEIDMYAPSFVWANGSTGPFSYYFYDLPTIVGISPKTGPTDGGTVVTLFGGRFFMDNKADLTCKFGDIIVPALQCNDTRMSCVSPPQPTGTVNVSVSENGISWSDGGTFSYEPSYHKVLWESR